MGSLRLLLLEEIIMCLTGKRICMAHSAAQWKEKLSDKNDGEIKKNKSKNGVVTFRDFAELIKMD